MCTCWLKDTHTCTHVDMHAHAYTSFLFPTNPMLIALGTDSQELQLHDESGTNHFPQAHGGGPHKLALPLLGFSPEISQVVLGAQSHSSWNSWSRSEVPLGDFSIYVLMTCFCPEKAQSKTEFEGLNPQPLHVLTVLCDLEQVIHLCKPQFPLL